MCPGLLLGAHCAGGIMFKEIINSTPFVGVYCEGALGYAKGGAYGLDRSLTSTLRALLYNRIPHDKALRVAINTVLGSRSNVGRIFSDYIAPLSNTLDIISVNSEAFDRLDDDVLWGERGYKKVEKVTIFFRKSFKTLCYIREEEQKSVVMVDNLDVRKLHFIQCAIPVFLPWFFTPENKLNDDEIKLIQSLAGNDSKAYTDALETIYNSLNLDLREGAIRSMLNGFEKRIFEASIQNLKNSIEMLERDIQARFDAIRDRMQDKTTKEIMLRGYLATRDQQATNEISDYFVANRSVDIEAVDGDRITFIPYGYMSFWDDNEFESLVTYEYSDLYEYGDRSFSRNDKALIMRAIFEEKVLKIKVCAAYSINLGAGGDRRVSGHSGYGYPGKFSDYMKNPHIDHYNCLGNYQYSINESLANGNVIMAVEQTIMSSRSLNLSDGAVMRQFYQSVFRSNSPAFFELPDGRSVNTTEALKWLKEREGNNGEEH